MAASYSSWVSFEQNLHDFIKVACKDWIYFFISVQKCKQVFQKTGLVRLAARRTFRGFLSMSKEESVHDWGNIGFKYFTGNEGVSNYIVEKSFELFKKKSRKWLVYNNAGYLLFKFSSEIREGNYLWARFVSSGSGGMIVT